LWKGRTVIQHSATIDPGNSGGPLLVRTQSNPPEFKVIGVNTWGANYRQNTFLSISLKDLKATIAATSDILKKKPYDPSLLRSTVTAFLSSLNTKKYEAWSAINCVSRRLAISKSISLLINSYYDLNKEDRNDWHAGLMWSELETLRDFLPYSLFLQLQKANKQVSLVSVAEAPDTSEGDSIYSVSLQIDNHTYITKWSYLLGSWQLIESKNSQLDALFDLGLKTPTPKPALGSTYSPDTLPNSIVIGLGISSLPTITGWLPAANGSFGFEIGTGKVLGISLLLHYAQGTALVKDCTQDTIQTLEIGISGRFGYLFPGQDVAVFPYGYAEATAGINADEQNEFIPSSTGGVGLRFVSKHFSVGFESGLRFVFDTPMPRLNSVPFSVYLYM